MDLLSTPASKKKIYSVSELNRETKDLLSGYFSIIQVQGEISNLSTPSSGHIYFTLKDQKAQIRCAMFKTKQRGLDFKPANGNQVIISAQVSLYETRGDYQLIVDRMQEAGDGELQQAFEQLKNKLLKQGLFEANIKHILPGIPQKIGVITSPTGAAIHDILSVLKRRFPIIPVIIYPTIVQGDSAKFEIINAIESANKQKQVDVIILARGGGTLEDLWAFNEECVARAIAKSKIPIVSGIGHEVDFTIADFVADLRAPTPSAAAENVVPDQRTWFLKFQSLESLLQQIIQRRLLHFQQSTSWLKTRLKQQHPGEKLQRYAQTLDIVEMRLVRNIQSKIVDFKNLIVNQHNQLQRQNPIDRIIRYKEQQLYLKNRLNSSILKKLENLQKNYLSLTQTLNAVSPLATLERGYAIVSKPHTPVVIRSSQQLSLNDMITTRFARGQIISQIKEINHE